MCRQLLCSSFARTAGDSDDGPVPFEVNSVSQMLQSRDGVINKKKLIFVSFQFVVMFLKPVRPDDTSEGSLFKSSDDELCRVVKISVKSVVKIVGLRKRK